ncbi:hypothetical protein IMZ11_14480 [Microtetraspora sp. AC03309]|uniref:hypothetical protein n=1 Tax=Microtetraspora sp. AC03309 TaxID=2779376 RepID=UPI001E59E18F|nr:hypothetical protein [Microtetraspora sp. AC03309]MCC5576836.1 hypothetical protein [Microtetraspora sp. AC03309]
MCIDAIGHLEKLGSELERRRFAVRVRAREGHATLNVTNVAAPALAESVFTAPDEEGDLWFWFPWQTPIGPVADITAAADRIERVLAEVGRPRPLTAASGGQPVGEVTDAAVEHA